MSNFNPTPTVEEPVTTQAAPAAATERSGNRPAYGAQNRLIEAYIHEASKYLEVAPNDPEINQVLTARGMDADEVATAKRLIQTSRDTFGARAHAVGQKTGTIQELTALVEEARHAYTVFREIARASFPENVRGCRCAPRPGYLLGTLRVRAFQPRNTRKGFRSEDSVSQFP